MSNETPELSIVIPVFNEQDSITDLVAAIRSALAPMADSYELLFVDDGSADGTLDALKTAALGQTNTMYPLLDCVRAYATVGEMCDALRQVWGEYAEVPSI